MPKNKLKNLAERKEDSHKGDFGHVLVIGGSVGMTGAPCLTSVAALLSGSGIVTCAVPKSLNVIVETKLTEIMTLPVDETKDLSMSKKAEGSLTEFIERKKISVVALGPGLSRNKETESLIKGLIAKIRVPLVLDADGINALEKDSKALLKRKEYVTVITPHPGEMSRLTGKGINYIKKNRKKMAIETSKKLNSIVCLKGSKSVVAAPDGSFYINETGNSGMSTAGAGDVLTGMIASFIGQGLEPYSSSVSGVYIHGLAGDMAAKAKGQFSMIASDVLDKIPQAMEQTL